MYPITCNAGFPMPLVAGKMEITGFSATIETPALVGGTAQIAIFDDKNITGSFGNLISVDDIYITKTLLADHKITTVGTPANTPLDGYIEVTFPETIKTRYGISIAASNIKGGSICVYRR